jgi:hypothetical protein
MKRFLFVGISLLLSNAIILPAQASENWTLLKNSDGIRSYERPVPGTKLKEFMAVTVIDAGMEVVGEALRDVQTYPLWLTDCATAKVEKKYDRNSMVIYMALTPPVLKQRDLVLKDKALYDWDNGKANVTFTSTEEIKVPAKDGCVRLSNMKGAFTMEYLGRNKTKFVYKLIVDPQVSFPVTIGMAYAVMKSYPYKTLEKLRTVALNKKYAELAKGTEEQKGIDMRATNEAAARTIFINRLQPYVKDKAAMKAVVEADPEIIKALVSSGNSYECNRQCTVKAFIAYLDKTQSNRNLCQKVRNDRNLQTAMVEMVETECGVDCMTVDTLVGKNNAK